MSNEDYHRIYQDAMSRGDKTITNPEWIREHQLRRQEAAMQKAQARNAKAQQRAQQNDEQIR